MLLILYCTFSLHLCITFFAREDLQQEKFQDLYRRLVLVYVVTAVKAWRHFFL